MVDAWSHIRARQSTIDKIRSSIKEDFLDHYPEFRSMRLSDDFLLNKMIDFYLEN